MLTDFRILRFLTRGKSFLRKPTPQLASLVAREGSGRAVLKMKVPQLLNALELAKEPPKTEPSRLFSGTAKADVDLTRYIEDGLRDNAAKIEKNALGCSWASPARILKQVERVFKSFHDEIARLGFLELKQRLSELTRQAPAVPAALRQLLRPRRAR